MRKYLLYFADCNKPKTMKKKLLLVASLLLAAVPAFVQNISYVLSTISEPLRKNAHTVTRYENTLFEVADADEASLKIHRVVTVLDADGKHALNFAQYTSKYLSLVDAEIKVYNDAGKQVGRYKKKDMSVQATGEGLIEDGYRISFAVPVTNYPVTVEYKYELKFKGTLGYPTFQVLSPGEGVELSSFTAKVPKDLDLRYKEQNISLKPQVTEEGKYKIYKWTVSNMPPIEDEEGAVSAEFRFPAIRLAPNRISFYGYAGDVSSWKNFGAWVANLYKGLDELPEARKNFFRDLVKNIPDEKEKIRVIYQYMQKNFRYVSIQLGIGGWRPFSAEFTDNKKYGDCKGLSNFMKAALKAVGINSYVALINAQYNKAPVDPDFPANRFNHAILCVPLNKDTVWLECTSNTAAFGKLGTFTENRNALLITEEGGVLAPTPVTKPEDNLMAIHTMVSVQEDGSGEAKALVSTTGRYREMMDYMSTEKKDNQKQFIVHGIGFKQPDQFNMTKQPSDDLHTTAIELSFEKVPEFIAGSKMFISLRMYKFWEMKLPKGDNRKLDYFFRNPFIQSDTTVYKLPEGYTIEALPKPKELSCPHATYSTQYWFNEKERAVYSTARLVLQRHRIPAAGYAAVKKFFDEVLLDEAQRIVVKKL